MCFRKHPVFLAIIAVFLLSVPPASAQDAPAAPVPAEPAQTGSLPAAPSLFADPPGGTGIVPVEPLLSTAEGMVEDLEEGLEEAAGGGFTLAEVVKKLGIVLSIVAVQILLIWLVWLLFKWFAKKIADTGGRKIKPLVIKKLRVLTTKQIISIIHFFLRICKYIITAFQLFLTIPLIFSIFPQTENVASTLFGYILTPLKSILLGGVRYIPNLITIIIIIMVAKYVLRGLKFFTLQIEREKLVLPGFYADWAQPTFNILRVLLYAFTVAVIYPYLPGSGSPAFQGVSVFVGLVFSLGSSTAVGNLVAGLVITYMRPFKIGDRIKLKDITGFVVEKSPIVTRIKTHKNEFVTFPNLMILNSSIINYNTSSDEDEEGLILHADITMGYSVPWPQVHEILIAAALKTANVLRKPKPYVLQTALDDFYARYQINVYTKEANKTPVIYSELYQNLQDGFKEAGIDMTAPTYQIRLNQDGGGTPSKNKQESSA
jgi:small-conductance mechanosensitive channel